MTSEIITLKYLTNNNMKLLTKEIIAHFEKVGSQESAKDPIIICKFFNPTGIGTWYATEYNPTEQIFFGYVSLFGKESGCDEWGSFALSELEEFKGRFGLGIERDIHFSPKPFNSLNLQ